MQESLVTLTTFSLASEANLVKVYLENKGVKAYIADELTALNLHYMGTAVANIKLQVDVQDQERALSILDHYQPTRNESVKEYSLEEKARRIFMTAILGAFFWPLEFYACYQFVCILFSGEKLTKKVILNLFLSALIILPLVVLQCQFLVLILKSLLEI